MRFKSITSLFCICILSGCGVDQSSTHTTPPVVQQQIIPEPETKRQTKSEQDIAVQVLPNSQTRRCDEDTNINVKPSIVDINKLYQFTGFSDIYNLSLVDFTDCNDHVITTYTTSDMKKALQTIAETEKYLFDVKVADTTDMKTIQTRAALYAANLVCIEVEQLLYAELSDDDILQDLITELSYAPSQDACVALYKYIKENYPNKVPDIAEKIQSEYFTSLINNSKETLSEYPFLQSVTVYDASGAERGTYTDKQASALLVLGEYTQQAIEAAVKDIYIDNDLNMNLSQFKENVWYRLEDPEHEEWTVSLYNDLNADILITKRSKQTSSSTMFVCGLNIDQTGPVYHSQGNIVYDLCWRYLSPDEDITRYIDENEIIRISKTSAGKTCSYPSRARYIYNDTDKAVTITASISDPSVLNAPVYVEQIPTHTIAGLDSANADAFTWQNY